jgi:DNA-binding SARP family transcriptional activator/LysM repeat protein
VAASGRGASPRRLTDIVGSGVTTLLVFAAVPTVLVVLVGDPLAGGLGHHWDHPARVAMSALALVAWVAWLACCAQLIRAVLHHVRRGHVGLPLNAPLTDRIAARIAVGILALTTLGAPIVVATTSSAATVTAVARVEPTHTPDHLPSTAAPGAVAATPYVVRPGDSLWTIAQNHLGDGGDWTAIAALNLGRTMTDGRRFVDPGLIYTGWDLIMPSNTTPPAPPATAAPVAPAAAAVPVAPSAPATTGRPTPAPTAPLTTARPTPAPTAPVPIRPEPTAPVSTTSVPTTAIPTATLPGRRPESITAAAPAANTSRRHSSSSLPELVALGLGAIGCAALARRSRQRRLLQQFGSSPPSAGPLPSERAIDTDVLLQRFADVPALDALERANCRLGRELLGRDASFSDPIIRAICVGAFGVDFWLSTVGLPPPIGFDLVEEGNVWHLPHHEMDGDEVDRPYFPIVLPIGDDAEGTWLLPLRAGTCLPIMGPAAEGLSRAARRVQEAWSWSDMVCVTDDPSDASRATQRYASDPDASHHDELPVLFFGDPAALPTATLSRVAVVTTARAAATDLSVLIDRQAASIHPLARTVNPHLADAETARLIDELLHPTVPTDDEPAVDDDIGSSAHDEAETERTTHVPIETSHEPSPLGPGLVEVRLLTMTPRLDGLPQELAPNRERRAVELVAYLALHRPDMVTGDRLRTRVLGSGDADAAAKTLFNTATAARHALGADEQGEPLLPLGTRTGHYRVSDAVSVDVQRAAALAAIGNSTEDPDLAMAHLRAALELVEGEPLANALSGYTWWESEGHGGRIAAVLVDAACNLAALAVQSEQFELAQWGLERARLVDPYSESLSRAAMQVAAAGGDADRLRREWRECQRRVDELDPGSSPSPRTERLYGELAQQVSA